MKKHIAAFTLAVLLPSTSVSASEWYLLTSNRGCEQAAEVARVASLPISSPGQWQDTIHGDVKILRNDTGNILRVEVSGRTNSHAFFYPTLELCLVDKAALDQIQKAANAKRSELY